MDLDWGGSPFWLIFGLAGQAAFFSRFLVQWLASERAGRSVVPKAFWYLSIVGTLVLLAYAIHRQEPVFMLGYLPNAFVYVRNLMLIERDRSARFVAAAEEASETAPAAPTSSWGIRPAAHFA